MTFAREMDDDGEVVLVAPCTTTIGRRRLRRLAQILWMSESEALDIAITHTLGTILRDKALYVDLPTEVRRDRAA